MNINELQNPKNFQNPVKLNDLNKDIMLHQLKLMYKIRRCEEIISDNVLNGNIKCPCHLAIGQEATPVAISAFLNSEDKVFGGHRSHAHFLALGGKPFELFSEVLGRVTGCSKGMGGSMHLMDNTVGFAGSVPIVGASVPISVGAGLALKMKNNDNIAVSYLGDSALEEGGVQESLNLASIMQLPVLFVVENNFFASHLHISLRQPSATVQRFAKCHSINSTLVDGNDISSLNDVASEAISWIRKNKRPFFVESITYRWKGHVGPSDDIDVGVKRNEDLVEWKKRDPIERLKMAFIINDYFTNKEFDDMFGQINSDLKNSWNLALESPYPNKNQLFETVFKYA